MAAQPPPGALPSGTKLQVGSHEAVIKRYISEGGFAHVYIVNISPPEDGSDIACLKRVVVPDKLHLNMLRAEVDAMKRLKGHPNIVKYFDSHAARLGENGSTGPPVIGYNRSDTASVGYEVLLLMEYCSKRGLIDFMNTRLREQLTETEILKIMSDVTNGLACMHYMQPPLIHRDLKIENVLISENNSYKLCDFGSVSPVLRPPKNAQELHILSEDIQRNTTAQYRAPEMIDIYRGFPIGEKCDIWALGVFLYKLCYYTTPFERDGQLAILHAKFTFPDRPAYSDRLKRIIRVTLSEDPRNRPNVYQVLKEVCLMRGVEVPIKDIYSQSAGSRNSSSHHGGGDVQMPKSMSNRSSTTSLRSSSEEAGAGVVYKTPSSSQEPVKQLPKVTPMYRGRPPKAAVSTPSLTDQVSVPKHRPQKPSKAVFSDPFSSLDRHASLRTSAPTSTSSNVSPEETSSTPEDVETRFPSVEDLSKSLENHSFAASEKHQKSTTPLPSSTLAKPSKPLPVPPVHSTAPPSKISYIDSAVQTDEGLDFESKLPQLPKVNIITEESSSPSSSTEYLNMPVSNRRNIPSRQRPMSMYARSNPSLHEPLNNELHQQSTADFLDERESSDSSSDHDGLTVEDREQLKTILTGVSERSSTMILESDNHIDSNVDFLRSLDTEGNHLSRASSVGGMRRSGHFSRTSSYSDASSAPNDDIPLDMPQPRRINRTSSSHSKRSSISSLKNLIGDTMKMFDGSSVSNNGSQFQSSSPGNYAIPTAVPQVSSRSSSITPNPSTSSQQLSSSNAANGSVPSSSSLSRSRSSRSHSRTTSGIQNRIQTLLSRRNSPPPKKTAEGYGKYTDAYNSDGNNRSSSSSSSPIYGYERHGSRNSSGTGLSTAGLSAAGPKLNGNSGVTSSSVTSSSVKTTMAPPTRSISAQKAAASKSPAPLANSLERYDSNTSVSSSASTTSTVSTVGETKSGARPSIPRKPVHLQSPKRVVPPGETSRPQSESAEDWEKQFNQKYPSLAR